MIGAIEGRERDFIGASPRISEQNVGGGSPTQAGSLHSASHAELSLSTTCTHLLKLALSKTVRSSLAIIQEAYQKSLDTPQVVYLEAKARDTNQSFDAGGTQGRRRLSRQQVRCRAVWGAGQALASALRCGLAHIPHVLGKHGSLTSRAIHEKHRSSTCPLTTVICSAQPLPVIGVVHSKESLWDDHWRHAGGISESHIR